MAKSTCSIDDCDRHATGRGWCQMHYQRWYRTGDPLTERTREASVRPTSTCSVDDCDRQAVARTYCSVHWRHWRDHGDPLYWTTDHRQKVCAVDGCERPFIAKTFCMLHYQHWVKTGDPLGVPDKSVPNRHERRPDGAMILVVTRRDGSEVRSVYDAADHPIVSARQWFYVEGGGYIVTNLLGGRSVKGLQQLHRLLVGVRRNDGTVVDHISGDRLDNRRRNLRVADSGLNGENRAVINELGSSKYRGVCWDGSHGRWKAYTRVSSVMHNVGFYPTEEAAAEAISRYRMALGLNTGYPQRHPNTPSRAKRQ